MSPSACPPFPRRRSTATRPETSGHSGRVRTKKAPQFFADRCPTLTLLRSKLLTCNELATDVALPAQTISCPGHPCKAVTLLRWASCGSRKIGNGSSSATKIMETNRQSGISAEGRALGLV